MDPWHNEYPLTADDVADIIDGDLPDLAATSARYFAEGWDFAVFAVETRRKTWLFRFPKRGECVGRLEVEYTTLDALRPALAGGGVQLPNYLHRVARPGKFPLPYGGYELLPGQPLMSLGAHQVDPVAIGTSLGAALRTIQASRPWPAPPVYRDRFRSHDVDFRRELDAVASVLPGELVQAMTHLMAQPEPPFEGPPRFTHADLGTEHILVDPAGMPTAIIDWGDAEWGDPRADLVGLWAWGGDGVVTAALDSADLPFDDDDWARLRYRGACICVGQAYYGHRSGREKLLDAAVSWLRRMYENGQLADVRATAQ